MEPTIRVTGKGTLSLTPDVTRLILTLEGIDKNYAKTLALSASKTETVKEILKGLGFAGEDLRTTGFSVDSEYEGYNDANGNWKNRFKGYRFRHNLKLEFAIDKDLLGRVLFALAESKADPELRIEYTIADTESAKNVLLAGAVADAKAKAAVLANAASVPLGDIVSIDYSFDEVDFVVRPMANMRMEKTMSLRAGNDCLDLDMNAEDIKVSDTVTITWQIGGGK